MPSRRKRPSVGKETHEEAPAPATSIITPIDQIRNSWEFAALGQYLFIFGQALKVPDSWTIEELEKELLMAAPPKFLPQVRMALLCNISSHKTLNLDQFEDYTRQLYQTKMPEANPFGEEEFPTKFTDLPLLMKIKVLHQLTLWTLLHPERLREKLDETSEKDQQQWRVEPCGYDADENSYFLLDDNRLYRRTEMKVPTITTTKQLKTPQKKASRPSKRRRVSAAGRGADAGGDDENGEEDPEQEMLNSMKWNCVCAVMDDWVAFAAKLKKSRHPDEKELHRYIIQDVIPVLEAAEEEKKKAELERQKKLALEAAVANRKRSSRVEAKMIRQKEEEERAEAERKAQEELRIARHEAQEKEKITREREKRLMTREKRLREREMRLALHQQGSNKGSGDDSETRRSSRRRNHERFGKEWVFDCICGVHGANYDDGTHSVACDRCEIWQHVSCLNLPPLEPGTEDKEFVCDRCLAREKQLLNGNEQTTSSTSSTRMSIKLRVAPLPMKSNGITQPNATSSLESRPTIPSEILKDPLSMNPLIPVSTTPISPPTLAISNSTISSLPLTAAHHHETELLIDEKLEEETNTISSNGVSTPSMLAEATGLVGTHTPAASDVEVNNSPSKPPTIAKTTHTTATTTTMGENNQNPEKMNPSLSFANKHDQLHATLTSRLLGSSVNPRPSLPHHQHPPTPHSPSSPTAPSSVSSETASSRLLPPQPLQQPQLAPSSSSTSSFPLLSAQLQSQQPQ